jgi:hypothetical protein
MSYLTHSEKQIESPGASSIDLRKYELTSLSDMLGNEAAVE